MNGQNKPYYITTPVYYVNEKPHIGHVYSSVICDILARYKRLDGYDVMFLTGTDEHGEKVNKSALQKGLDLYKFTNDSSQKFRDLTIDMNLSNNDFIRTTENRHKKACQSFWNTLIQKNEIYLGSYEGWYSIRDEAFYTTKEIITHNGQKFAPTGAPVEWISEPSYFFRLSKWQDRLLDYYKKHPEFILPISRRNEIIKFVESGLHDLSVSRTSFKWGIPVPNDGNHVMYVWFDALINYLTAVGYPDRRSQHFQKYWPVNLHIIGKDILRFHAVYWPAFLLAADIEIPKCILAHGWWTNEGKKISKSIGNIIDPYILIKKYGLDQTRYFLLREMSFSNDGNFSHDRMIKCINSELSNDIGNMCQRVLLMIYKNCNQSVPTPSILIDIDNQILQKAYTTTQKIQNLLLDHKLHKILELILNLVSESNRYIDIMAPWKLKKIDCERMETVLYVLIEIIRHIAVLIQPIMPSSADKILNFLGISKNKRNFDSLCIHERLIPKSPIPKPYAVFPRYIQLET